MVVPRRLGSKIPAEIIRRIKANEPILVVEDATHLPDFLENVHSTCVAELFLSVTKAHVELLPPYVRGMHAKAPLLHTSTFDSASVGSHTQNFFYAALTGSPANMRYNHETRYFDYITLFIIGAPGKRPALIKEVHVHKLKQKLFYWYKGGDKREWFMYHVEEL
jgi:hypothetical protein